MADILGIGYSGLAAAQRALSTTSHNISNANTDGYSRQTVDLATNPAQRFGSSYLGNGVNVASVKRIYDEFLVNQVRVNTSSFSSVDTFQQLASSIDNLLGDSNTSLNAGIDNFFNSVHQVANNPSSQAARQTLLSQADSLVSNFQYINTQLNQGYVQVNTAIADSVTQINSLAKNIAELNNKIVLASGSAGGGQPNDLLDQRDAQLAKLANLVTVSTVKESNGAVNVFIGNGQSLVVGSSSQALNVIPNIYDPTRNEIGYSTSGSGYVNISAQISGGSLGGLLNFRNQVLDPTKNELGRLAVGMASALNTQNSLGMDLNGDLGGDIFAVASPVVSASSTNSGTGGVTSALISPNALTTSDYKLVYNGGNSYSLTRLSDGQDFTIDTGGSSPYTSTVIDGISLTISAGAVAGDSFLIRPTRAGADDLKTVISDPSKIAAAVPVTVTTPLSNVGTATADKISVNNPDDRVVINFTSPTTYDVLDQTTGATLAQGVSYTSGGNISFNGWTVKISDGGSSPASGDTFYVDQGVTSADSGNTGGAVIGQAAVSPPDSALTDPVTITFTSPTTYTVTGATTGSPTVNVPFSSGDTISYNGWNLSISGSPATGDSFNIGPNTNGVGDNGNALQIAALQTKLTMADGTASFQDAYGQIIADIGVKTQAAGTSRDALNALLQQSTDARNAVSGVNLDEEAANMLKYQQAYQAAAKVIATSDTLFQSLLSAMNG
jgi:flagellar hook-associated protein 1 FlgK